MTASRPILYQLCRLALGLTFLYAGLLKATDVKAFAGNVGAYELLPYAWNYAVAAILPLIEIFAGLLLVFNTQVRPSALILGGMNVVFMIALVSLIWRGMEIDCGCFSQGEDASTTSPLMALIRDVALMVLIVVVYRFAPSARVTPVQSS